MREATTATGMLPGLRRKRRSGRTHQPTRTKHSQRTCALNPSTGTYEGPESSSFSPVSAIAQATSKHNDGKGANGKKNNSASYARKAIVPWYLADNAARRR
jgi:hypothetical protein